MRPRRYSKAWCMSIPFVDTVSNSLWCHRWSTTTRIVKLGPPRQPNLPVLIKIHFFQTSIAISTCCCHARKGKDGRQSYAGTLRTCPWTLQKILTLWNGGRCVFGFNVLSNPHADCLQNNRHLYHTLHYIAIDYLASPASSVPCEQLFSGGGEIATKHYAQLGATHFKELQVMKFVWRHNIGDFTAQNSSQVEEIDDKMGEYRDLLTADRE